MYTSIYNYLFDVSLINFSTSIIYNIYPMSSPAILVIRDITGREEIRFNLVEATDQLYWDTSNVLSGMYYYSLQSGNTNLSNGKIVVKK